MSPLIFLPPLDLSLLFFSPQGMNNHPLIQYKAEKGLQEVLCTLDGLRRPLDEMSSRIKLAMDKDPGSWVLSNLAALYWRIVGQGQLAIRCLKHALYYSDENARVSDLGLGVATGHNVNFIVLLLCQICTEFRMDCAWKFILFYGDVNSDMQVSTVLRLY